MANHADGAERHPPVRPSLWVGNPAATEASDCLPGDPTRTGEPRRQRPRLTAAHRPPHRRPCRRRGPRLAPPRPAGGSGEPTRAVHWTMQTGVSLVMVVASRCAHCRHLRGRLSAWGLTESKQPLVRSGYEAGHGERPKGRQRRQFPTRVPTGASSAHSRPCEGTGGQMVGTWSHSPKQVSSGSKCATRRHPPAFLCTRRRDDRSGESDSNAGVPALGGGGRVWSQTCHTHSIDDARESTRIDAEYISEQAMWAVASPRRQPVIAAVRRAKRYS